MPLPMLAMPDFDMLPHKLGDPLQSIPDVPRTLPVQDALQNIREGPGRGCVAACRELQSKNHARGRAVGSARPRGSDLRRRRGPWSQPARSRGSTHRLTYENSNICQHISKKLPGLVPCPMAWFENFTWAWGPLPRIARRASGHSHAAARLTAPVAAPRHKSTETQPPIRLTPQRTAPNTGKVFYIIIFLIIG